ncbi:NTP pyrophosphatase, house-cleaning of non-canonical NTPs [Halobiforma haloterrestris]|uniref:NTP pyrophosphatase, house-cleaning of non-canonical NTPs n=1 Tax=Natronobacterium haloterrestre TaxID=148448 RepID=A0A1I1GVA6_NATHA|nr:MazG-like family protein [Halobiforma haloterrestris]SFC15222.1 NTP pyrophosphatase, house-cleaning of non-canonical NTPs [Halobiforma haloterrestris]
MDVDDAQRQVAEFVQEHDLETPPEFRLLDLVSEMGELAKDANTSTDYGDAPADLDLAADEVGDALFALLALADALEIDAEAALAEALEKYEARMATGAEESPGSGE